MTGGRNLTPAPVRKDATPAETIERLHAVLDALGFPRERLLVHRWTAGKECHSCHLRFTNFPVLYSNGKGVSPELALASGLAEFVERLQCFADLTFSRAGDIHRLAPIAPTIARRPSEIATVAPRLASHELAALTDDEPGSLPCVPFVDVFRRRLVDLPLDALLLLTGSNGMCAGNSAAEALAQGICEVFERHVIHQLENGRVPGLPTIPIDRLPLTSDIVRRQVEDLLAAGIAIVVKDGSLGGVYPVVGVVLADGRTGACHVSFGSDPCFDAALSRCLTEAFQGTARLVRQPAAERGARRPIDTYNNVEVLAEALAPSVGQSLVDRAFAAPATSADALREAVRRVRETGSALYVRDFSMFGFPSYYVFIEGLSALGTIGADDLGRRERLHGAVRRTLFRLAGASRNEVAECARLLFDEMSRSPLLEKQFASSVLAAPVLTCIGLRPLLTAMLLEAGATGDARRVVEWPPVGSPVLEKPVTPADVRAILPAYARARRGAAPIDVMTRAFDTAFTVSELPADGPPAAGEPDSLLLPRCASVYHCPGCPCRRLCRLDEWYRLARGLRDRAVPVSQASLLDIFDRLLGAPSATPDVGDRRSTACNGTD